MAYCSACGAYNKDGARYCLKCGSKIDSLESSTVRNNNGSDTNWNSGAGERIVIIQQEKKHRGKAVWVVIAIIIIALGGYFLADNYGHHGYVSYEVYSTHVLYPTDVTVYFDGKQVAYWEDLKPGEYIYSSDYIPVYFSLFEKAHLLTVKAISTGGGLGPQTHTETITISDGNKEKVVLYI